MRPWTSEGVGCGILSILVGMGMAVWQFSSLWYCGDCPRAIPKRMLGPLADAAPRSFDRAQGRGKGCPDA